MAIRILILTLATISLLTLGGAVVVDLFSNIDVVKIAPYWVKVVWMVSVLFVLITLLRTGEPRYPFTTSEKILTVLETVSLIVFVVIAILIMISTILFLAFG